MCSNDQLFIKAYEFLFQEISDKEVFRISHFVYPSIRINFTHLSNVVKKEKRRKSAIYRGLTVVTRALFSYGEPGRAGKANIQRYKKIARK